MANDTTTDITIDDGSTTVTINTMLINTVHPSRNKSFREVLLQDGTITIDEPVNPPRRKWEYENVVPLTNTQKTDLETLYNLTAKTLTLTDNFKEASVAYSVYFADMRKRQDVPLGDEKYRFRFIEVG